MKKCRTLIYIMVVGAGILVMEDRAVLGGKVRTYDLSFKGAASGGTLVLSRVRNRNQQYISILTTAGESAESVAQRLADAINDRDPFGWNKDLLEGEPYRVGASGGALLGLPGGRAGYALAGTEEGLGIPKAPLFLSCSYDKASDKVVLQWINRPGGYDSVCVQYFWDAFNHGGGSVLAGNSTTFTIDRTELSLDVEDMDFRLMGFRNNVPSNVAGIHVSGWCQEETYGIPFSDGVAPNWRSWGTGTRTESRGFEQGEKYTDLRTYYYSAKTLSTKRFYQILKGSTEAGMHGVWRKFVGLTGGHTYRLTAHLSTLDMDSVKGDWSLAICAAHNGLDGRGLTAEEMAGEAALPDGSKGLEAGRVALYDGGNTTTGTWETILTGYKAGRRPAGPHITLPSGVDSITVWVRFSCSDPNGEVGFSGVSLEDVTAAGNKLKTPEEVIKENRRDQAELRVGDAWLKERAARSKNAE